MKNIFLLLLAMLWFMGCTTESDDLTTQSNKSLEYRGAGKVNICHNGHIINVSRSAIPAHLAHGDAIDDDGDGYYSHSNTCGVPVDCNDGDAGHNVSCCPAGSWCGDLGPFNITIIFNGDCGALVNFPGSPGYPCEVPVTWVLNSSNGNTFVYTETDLCGVNGCQVTVTDNGTTLHVVYGCASASGDVVPCE